MYQGTVWFTEVT